MKIILERNLDFNQFKNVFILDFLSIAFFVMLLKLEAKIILQLLIIALILILTSLLIIRKGIITDKDRLFIGYFLFATLIMKKQIEDNGMNIITLLTYQKSTNYNYGTKWEPGLDFKTPSFELYFVNEKHTLKKRIILLTKENNSKIAIDFLLHHAGVQFQTYSPKFD